MEEMVAEGREDQWQEKEMVGEVVVDGRGESQCQEDG